MPSSVFASGPVLPRRDCAAAARGHFLMQRGRSLSQPVHPVLQMTMFGKVRFSGLLPHRRRSLQCLHEILPPTSHEGVLLSWLVYRPLDAIASPNRPSFRKPGPPPRGQECRWECLTSPYLPPIGCASELDVTAMFDALYLRG